MSFRSLLTASEPQLGTMVAEFATPGIGHILKAADLDFGFLDMEHSGFGMGDLKTMLSYFQAADLPVILRPPSKSSHHLSRALDAGADALLLPMVNSAAEATDLVAAIKYPPEGVRGVALGFAPFANDARGRPRHVGTRSKVAMARGVTPPLLAI